MRKRSEDESGGGDASPAAAGGSAGRDLRMAPTVLIIDDVPLNVALIEHILESEGFRTCSADTGAAGVATCRELRPDLILLDVTMPDESGFETCLRLKSDPQTADIPVIFLSTLSDVSTRVKGLKIGAVDFVSKPVHPDEVLARVRVHLRIRENNRAIARAHERHIEELRDAQRAILVRPEQCPEARFEICYRPLEETGGDFYDVVMTDAEVFSYFVADVSGHGAGAAFITSAVKAMLRQYTGPMFAPEDTMRGINSVMHQILSDEQYLTACHARLNLRNYTLTVVSAGHPPLIRVTGSGEAELIEAESDPVGVFNSMTIQRRDVSVDPGDRFFLYTDGLIEACAGGCRRAGTARLLEACIRHRTDPLKSAVTAIVDETLNFSAAVADDVLLLGVRVGP